MDNKKRVENMFSNNLPIYEKRLFNNLEKWETDYLQRRFCIACDKCFITGNNLTKEVEDAGKEIFCPYCGSHNNLMMACEDEEAHSEDLGCIGISYISNSYGSICLS